MSQERPRLYGNKLAAYNHINKKESRILVIGDLHEPFCLDGYLEHCKETYKNYQDEMVDVPEVDIFSSAAPVSRDLDLKELDIEQQQSLNEVEHYQKSDLITEEDAKQIKLANEDVQRAETSFQSAAEAAARCLVR